MSYPDSTLEPIVAEPQRGRSLQIPTALAAQIGGSALLVYVALANHCDDAGTCFPSLATLTEECDSHTGTVVRALHELEAAGLVVKQRRFNASTLYTLPHQARGVANSPVAKTEGGRKFTSRKNRKSTSRKNRVSQSQFAATNSSQEHLPENSSHTEVEAEPSRRKAGPLVFEHWQKVMNHPRAILDDKRKARISWALRHYGLEQTLAAIDGCARSPYHMGGNDTGQRHDDLTLIFRDATHVERFLSMPMAPARPQRCTTVVERNTEIMDGMDAAIARQQRGEAPLPEDLPYLDPFGLTRARHLTLAAGA